MTTDAVIRDILSGSRAADRKSADPEQAQPPVNAPPVQAAADCPPLATLLDGIHSLLGRYVAFPSPSAHVAVTLWAAHAHVVSAFDSTPRLAVVSPEKGSGKTRCLEVLELVVPEPMHAVNCSAPALFRAVAMKQPTLLFDEADTYFGPHAREHEELRGLINAGHRRGAVAYRVVGDGASMEVKEFPAFAAVAIAAIGALPDTILDRAVLVSMKRRAPTEQVESFRYRKVAPFGHALRDQLAVWAKRNGEELGRLEPDLPAGIVDRAADVWEPLVAIGVMAGAAWPELARAAAVALNGERAAADSSLGVRLLADIRTLIGDRAAMSTTALLAGLIAMDESPWGDLRGRPLDPRGLARMLRRYEVRPKQHRSGDANVRGYERVDLTEAWSRYLPGPATSATPATPQVSGPNSVAAPEPVADGASATRSPSATPDIPSDAKIP